MSVEDIEYYRRRARQELELAEKADGAEAAQAHAELAKFYQGLVERSDYLPGTRALSSVRCGFQSEGLSEQE